MHLKTCNIYICKITLWKWRFLHILSRSNSEGKKDTTHNYQRPAFIFNFNNLNLLLKISYHNKLILKKKKKIHHIWSISPLKLEKMFQFHEKFNDFFNSRWLVFVCSMWIQSCSGAGYLFGSISPVIKSTMGYNQKQIAILGVAKDLGACLGFVAGSLSEVLPSWGLLLIGAVHNFVGYGLLWLVVTQRLPTLPLWVVSSVLLYLWIIWFGFLPFFRKRFLIIFFMWDSLCTSNRLLCT